MSRLMIGLGALVLGGALVALSAALFTRDAPEWTPGPAASANGELAARVEALGQRVADETASRAALADEVQFLGERVDALARRLGEDGVLAPEPAGAPAPEDVAAARRPERSSRGELDEQALVAAGFGRSEVDAIRSRLDAIALERLFLEDRATREGWRGSRQYAEGSRELRTARRELRDEFGDELYDWVLYTSGRPNRVRVGRVMEGSPAEQAGLQRGDVLDRYGGSRVLGRLDLRELSQGGRAGELTALDVRRDDDEIRLYVPRGPLGITIDPVVREPEPVR